MNSNFKAVVIDLDNVLYDTELLHYMSWKTMCSETGLPFDRESFKKLRGLNEVDGLEAVLKDNPWFKAPPILREMLSTKVRLLYRQYLVSLTPAEVSDVVMTTLQEIKRRGCRLIIGSSGENAANVLDKLGLLDMADCVYSRRVISPFVEDRDVFTEICAEVGLEPGDCLAVQSTLTGAASAYGAGMTVAGIGDGASFDKCSFRLESFASILDVI